MQTTARENADPLASNRTLPVRLRTSLALCRARVRRCQVRPGQQIGDHHDR
jgi:hypothetical protein